MTSMRRYVDSLRSRERFFDDQLRTKIDAETAVERVLRQREAFSIMEHAIENQIEGCQSTIGEYKVQLDLMKDQDTDRSDTYMFSIYDGQKFVSDAQFELIFDLKNKTVTAIATSAELFMTDIDQIVRLLKLAIGLND